MEKREREWSGSPLDIVEGSMDPYGVSEVVIEFGNGDRDIFRPRRRAEFKAYEMHQMATYLDSIAHSVRNVQRD